MRTALFCVILLVLAGGLLLMATDLSFGHPLRSDMDDYFIRHGQYQTGVNNIVTSIVFDFRGFGHARRAHRSIPRRARRRPDVPQPPLGRRI